MPSRGKSFRSFLRPPRRPLGLFLYVNAVSNLCVVVDRIGHDKAETGQFIGKLT
jgi:hypothetical protein